MDAQKDSSTPLNPSSASSNACANAFTPTNRPSRPLASSTDAEIAASDAGAYENEEDPSPSASEASDDSTTLGNGVCERWNEDALNTAIFMFKHDLSTEWVFLFLHSVGKNDKIKLHHVARFRALWEKRGRKDAWVTCDEKE